MKNTEIFALSLLIIITIISTTYYNYNKSKVFNNYKSTINNVYLKKTLNHLFSFNSPKGACKRCDGLGSTYDVSWDLLVPNDSQSINDGAIRFLGTPRGVFVLKYGDNVLNEKFISSIISFVFLYIIIFFLITALLSISGLDFITSISGAATAISNVGPGLGGMIGPNGNFSLLPDFSKWVLSIGMILGRLELFAYLFLLFGEDFNVRKKTKLVTINISLQRY